MKGSAMFYRPSEGHGLPHNPFGALISPRPIGWISSRGQFGDNLAPYSFFNAVAYEPPQVMFASTSAKPDRDGTKDSVANIRETGVFAVNIVALSARDVMNASSGAHGRGTDEFDISGAPKAACHEIDCPRVADAPAVLECRLTQEVTLPGAANIVIFGEVLGIHINDAVLRDGQVDVTLYKPLARLGYRDYAAITEVFSLARPGEGGKS